MKLFILKIEALEILKTIEINNYISTLIENKKYSTLYPSYDETIHMAYQANSLPEYRKLVDGVIVSQTKYERYLDGTYTLIDGEIVEDEKVKVIRKPYSYYKWYNDEWVYDDELYSEYEAEKLIEIRARRDELLAQTDYMMMSDYPIPDEDLAELTEYRQALRDLPDAVDFDVDNFEYPTPPSFVTVEEEETEESEIIIPDEIIDEY